MITQRQILYVLLPVLLIACSTTPEEEQEPELPPMDEMLARLTEDQRNTCINFRDIEVHKMVAEDVVSISMRRGGHYLASTARSCRFLGNSNGTLVSDSWGMLCKGSGAVVDYDSDRFCPIRNIYEFESREEAMKTLKVAQARREAEALIPNKEP